MNLLIGQRMALPEGQQKSILSFSFKALGLVDISAFALSDNDKLVSEDYMIFYNQPNSPCQSIKLTDYQQTNNATSADFLCNLAQVPSNVASIYFVISSDNLLSQVQSMNFSLSAQGGEAINADYKPSDFGQTQATMLIQLYKKNNQWRVSNVAQGFNGGLPDVVRHFGGEVADTSPAPAPVAPTPKLSLEKIINEKAPSLINLAKKATVSLEKNQLLGVKANVALVLDASGSMNNQYSRGIVQEVVNRLVPLAVNFDADMSIDCWAFGDQTQYLGEVNLNNYSDFINTSKGGWKAWQLGSRVNNEPDAIRQVVKHYASMGLSLPAYVLFISDGGVHDNGGITKAIIDSCKLPIFWQFVGLGGNGYGILKRLDTMQGRFIDNCNFFELDNLHQVSEEQLYDMMLSEFPQYIKEARKLSLTYRA